MAEDDDLRAGVEDLLGQFGSLLDKAKPKDSVVKSTSSAKPAPEKNGSQKPVSKAAPAPPVMPVRKYNKAGPFLVASEKQEKEEAAFGLNTAPVTANGAQSERRNARPFEQKKPNNDISKPKEKKSNQTLSAPSTTLDSQIDFAALSASKMTGKLCSGQGCWFDHVPPVPSVPAVPAATETAPAGQSLKRKREAEPPRISLPVLDRLFSLGQTLLAAEEAAGEGKGGKQAAAAAGGDEAWMRSVLQSGTAGDKLAALTLLAARHPMSSGRHLDSLLALAGKKSRRESQAAMDALKDVFINNLLPPDRRLLPFISKQRAQQAAALLGEAGDTGISAAHLVFWTWEDSLSKRFAKFIECLASHAADGITHFKLHALATANELLQSRPEGEAALLQLLAHKLGDKENKVASRAVYLLLKTAEAHPAMAPVLARAVQQVVLDPSASESQVYYGITFLNQIPLKRDSPAHSTLATNLIETYFTLFEHSVGAGMLEAKLLSALLVGVNRAVPYAPSDGAATATLEAKADSVFTVLHKGTFAASVQALTLLQHVAQRKMELVAAGGASAPAAGDTFVDRFYRALYGQLDAVLLGATNKHALFLNLLFRAIKADTHAPRARAVMKRLCACALHMSAPFSAGVVLLVGEVLRKRPDLLALLTQPEGSAAAQAGREAAAEAAQQLQQANEAEQDSESGSMDAGVASGDKAAALAALDAAMEEEEEEDEDAPVLHMQVKAVERSKAPVPAAAAATVQAQPATSVVETDVSRTGVYDPLKREPKYAGAERACLWEIGPLASHFHPSVRLFADRVLSRALDGSLASEGVGYEGDPLADFTLIAFLDRLAYKNPKKRDIAAYGSKEEKDKAGIRTPSFGPGGAASAEDELAAGYAEVQGLTSSAGERALAMGLVRGTSVMQKKGARHGRADVAAPANSSAFLRTEASAVPVEEAFLHSYFAAKAAQDEAAGRKSKRTQEDAGHAGDDDASDAESESSLFAQELAEKLLRSADPDADIDDDLGGYESDEGEQDEGGEQQDEEGEGGESVDDEDEDEDDSGIDEFDEHGELIEEGRARGGSGVRRGELDDSEEEEGDDEDSEEEEARPRASKGAKQRVSDGEDDEDDEMDEEDFLDEDDDDDDEEEEEGEAEGKAAATQGGKKRGDSVFAAADDFADVLASDSEGSDASGEADEQHRRKRGRKSGGSSDEDEDEDSDDDERRGKKPAFKWGQRKEADLYSDDDDGGDSAPARRGRGGGSRGRGGSRGGPPRGRGGQGARGGRGGFRGGKGPSGGGARPFARGRGGRGRR